MAQFRLVPINTKVPFIKNHKKVLYPAFALCIITFILPLLASFFPDKIPGPNWGTSFRGGTAITIHFDKEIQDEAVRTGFTDPRFQSVSVQPIGNEADHRYVIRTRTTTTLTCDKLEKAKKALQADVSAATNNVLVINQWPVCNSEKEDGIRGDFFVSFSPVEGKNAPDDPLTAAAVQAALEKAELSSIVSYEQTSKNYLVKPTGLQSEVTALLKDKFAAYYNADPNDDAAIMKAVEGAIDQIDSVGADVGEKFRNDAIVSILVALALMLLYIGIRFDTRYAPAAVISLAVSTVVTFLCIILLQLEITLETVAAMLSIVGYGINDTIVTFDRVRENVGLAEPGVALKDIVNKAINECLSRTAITSITTIIAIIPLCVYATGPTRDFAIVMLIGICVTTLNSIFISCPMFLKFDEIFKKWQERSAERKEYEELNASNKPEIDI
ncbi:MAG: protein translocase subunit SecF [Proteobacteria bacterium]|nr:protein translocase subunit SecF [Pseudomonadota bacterium]